MSEALDIRSAGNARQRPGPSGRGLALVAVTAALAAGYLVVGTAPSGTVTRQTFLPPPLLSEPAEVEAPATPVAPEPTASPEGPIVAASSDSIAAAVPGLVGTLRMIVPAEDGSASLWEWAAHEGAPRIVPLPADLHRITFDRSGTVAAALDADGILHVGDPADPVPLDVVATSLVWHGQRPAELAWLQQADHEEHPALWRSIVTPEAARSFRVAILEDLDLRDADETAFLVAYGDWGYALVRNPAGSADLRRPRSEVLVIDPSGNPGEWVSGRLLAAAPDGKLLLGATSMAGPYPLEQLDARLGTIERLPGYSLGVAEWSPAGDVLFTVVDYPPRATFELIGPAKTARHSIDALRVDPLGWSPDGRFYMLGAVLPDAETVLLFADSVDGSLDVHPVARLPQVAALRVPTGHIRVGLPSRD